MAILRSDGQINVAFREFCFWTRAGVFTEGYLAFLNSKTVALIFSRRIHYLKRILNSKKQVPLSPAFYSYHLPHPKPWYSQNGSQLVSDICLMNLKSRDLNTTEALLSRLKDSNSRLHCYRIMSMRFTVSPLSFFESWGKIHEFLSTIQKIALSSSALIMV
jgi:hypothetical protein